MPELEDPRPSHHAMPDNDALSATDIGAYVLDLVRGIRRMTRATSQKDVRFLDYLLAITEDQAAKIAENSYH